MRELIDQTGTSLKWAFTGIASAGASWLTQAEKWMSIAASVFAIFASAIAIYVALRRLRREPEKGRHE